MTSTPLYPTAHSTTCSRKVVAPQPTLAGIGCAVPEAYFTQHEITQTLAARWQLTGRDLQRWLSMCEGAGIDGRHGVVAFDETLDLSTGQRMNLYESLAPPLARHAAVRAMEDAGVSPEHITDLIVVSCTGFSAPGLDVALCRALELQPTVRRTMVTFMGCYGAISGLRTAVGACSADPSATALVVCAELCTLHARPDTGIDNQVATALFGDGAAAAVVVGHCHRLSQEAESGNGYGRLTTGYSRLLPEGRDWMTWRATDAGFAMTLSREVPVALRRNIARFVDEACETPPASFVVHPGGPGILDAVQSGLELPEDDAGLVASRAVLRRYGNMSSATILFAVHETRHAPQPAMLLAFGPGLTLESLTLRSGRE